MQAYDEFIYAVRQVNEAISPESDGGQSPVSETHSIAARIALPWATWGDHAKVGVQYRVKQFQESFRSESSTLHILGGRDLRIVR